MNTYLLHQLRLALPDRETRLKVWRAMPVTGPLFHVSTDGKWRVNTIECAIRRSMA